VILKLHKELPDKPRLAQSLAAGLQSVSASLDVVGPQTLKFTGLDHERLVEVFDQIQKDIDNWQELATVEETPGALFESRTGRTFLTDVDVPAVVWSAHVTVLQQKARVFVLASCMY
jgi:hypothetical protein